MRGFPPFGTCPRELILTISLSFLSCMLLQCLKTSAVYIYDIYFSLVHINLNIKYSWGSVFNASATKYQIKTRPLTSVMVDPITGGWPRETLLFTLGIVISDMSLVTACGQILLRGEPLNS